MAKKIQQPYLRLDHEQRKLNKILTLQRDNDILAMLLDGRPTREISDLLQTKYGIKHSSATVFISQCRQEIKRKQEFELNNVISIHIHRYEEIYKQLMELGMEGLAMNALRAKEKMMGFHRQGFHMKVTQGQVQQVYTSKVTDEYDLKKLNPEDKQRLDQLLIKAKRSKR